MSGRSVRHPERSPPPPSDSAPGRGRDPGAGASGRDDDDAGGRDDVDKIIANAHEVIAEWDKMQPTTYSELSPTNKKILEDLLIAYLPLKLAETISEEYAKYPENMRQLFVDKVVGAEIGQALYYARMLLASYFGLNADIKIDIDLQNHDPEVLNEYELVLTGVIELTHNTSDFSISLRRMIETAAEQPVKNAIKVALAPFAVKVAQELAPVGTAIVNSATSGVVGGLELTRAISNYAFGGSYAAFYAAVYVALTNIDKLFPSEAPAGDLQGIFVDLSKRAERESREQITGIKPDDTSTVWGVANYLFWHAKSACVSQAELASSGAVSVYKQAAAAPILCKKLVEGARTLTSNAAKYLESSVSQGVTDVTRIAFHDKLRHLLLQPKFVSLQTNESVKKHMKNLVLDDPRPNLPFEYRLECFAATQVVQARNPREVRAHMPPEDSQEAQRGSQPDMTTVDSQAASAEWAGLPNVTDVLGPNGDFLGQIPINPEKYNGSMSDQGGGRSRSRKRSASKRTRRKASAKKQKSKKNKRQSRRKVRRSSSRKSRK